MVNWMAIVILFILIVVLSKVLYDFMNEQRVIKETNAEKLVEE